LCETVVNVGWIRGYDLGMKSREQGMKAKKKAPPPRRGEA